MINAIKTVLMYFFLTTFAFASESYKGWVPLVNHDMYEWASINALQRSKLCLETLPSPQQSECKKKYLQPKLWKIPVFSKPKNTSTQLGEIILKATPEKGFEAMYQATGKKGVRFTPDLYDSDFGYGPYFHQTALAVEGDWVKLPQVPFKQPVWINTKEFISTDWYGYSITKNSLLSFSEKSIVVLDVKAEGIMYRLEQPGDMWCEGGDAPAVIKVDAQWAPNHSLYDHNGHFLLGPSYMRGC